MNITCISDIHGFLPKLEGGDLLIVAGDLTAQDSEENHLDFMLYLYEMTKTYKNIVYIAGNHDGMLDPQTKRYGSLKVSKRNIFYLCDSAIEIDGIKIYGSPWTPTYHRWHFMKDRGIEIKKMWDKIPRDVDILITHGPAWGILDEVGMENTGCEELRKIIDEGVIKPRLHVFGHIHEQGGKQIIFKGEGFNTLMINASIMNENYEPVNLPQNIYMRKKNAS